MWSAAQLPHPLSSDPRWSFRLTAGAPPPRTGPAAPTHRARSPAAPAGVRTTSEIVLSPTSGSSASCRCPLYLPDRAVRTRDRPGPINGSARLVRSAAISCCQRKRDRHAPPHRRRQAARCGRCRQRRAACPAGEQRARGPNCGWCRPKGCDRPATLTSREPSPGTPCKKAAA
jgi:hypothetical protein